MEHALKRVGLCLALGWLAGPGVGNAWGQTGTALRGTVTAESGEAAPGALVVAMPRGLGAAGGKGPVYSVLAGRDGSYRLDGIAAGDYVLCVQSADERLVSSCRWPAAEAAVTMDSARQETTANLTLRAGIVLRFRVDDPEQLLPATGRANAPGIFLAGVWTRQGFFEPAQLKAEDKRGLEFVLTVPTTEELTPYVDARNVRILGENGALHRAESVDSLKPGRKDKEILFHFRVTGLEVRKNQ